MLKEVVTEFPEKSKTLQECYDSSDWKNYQIYVHALKSNLRSVGATELSDLAKTLEKAAESEDVALINEKHGILIGKYKKLAEDIESSVI